MRATVIWLQIFAVLAGTSLYAADYKLKVTPENTAWGYYWSEAKPVLTIKSGDIVEVQTDLDTDSCPSPCPRRPPAIRLPPRCMRCTRRSRKSSAGGQQLTGPIFIEGAQPGDVLEVRILKIRMDLPYAYNGYGNFMFKDFERGAKIVPLDREKNGGACNAKRRRSSRTFFWRNGALRHRPPWAKSRAGPPGIHAGNLDNRDLVAGTTLYIPIHVPGALFEVGGRSCRAGRRRGRSKCS